MISRQAETDQAATNTDLHVEDSGGSGRPVILIHGWPLSSQAWRHQIGRLAAAGFRVIAYDRRGFGQSRAPSEQFDYNTLATDLHQLIESLNLRDATLVGFSMGGGEVARYVGLYGEERLASVVFAAAVPPYLLNTEDNPEGPLPPEKFQEMRGQVDSDPDAFYENFVDDFYAADGRSKVGEAEKKAAIGLCRQADKRAVLGCMDAWAKTDFRNDLDQFNVPCLLIHGDSDAIVPLQGSAERTNSQIKHSQLVVLEGAPHGCNVSHADLFNRALLEFL